LQPKTFKKAETRSPKNRNSTQRGRSSGDWAESKNWWCTNFSCD